MSTINENTENYKSIDSDKENGDNFSNKEEGSDKRGNVVEHIYQGESFTRKQNTPSACKENTYQLEICHKVNVLRSNKEQKLNDQSDQKIETELSVDKALKKKMKRKRQKLNKKSKKMNQEEEVNIEKLIADIEELQLRNKFIEDNLSKMTSSDPYWNITYKALENNSNGNSDYDKEMDWLSTVPAFVHAAIKKDNKILLSMKTRKLIEEDDITEVNLIRQNITSEIPSNDNDEYYDIGMENDFTLVKYKHSKHPDSFRTSKEFATLAIKLILENQISEAIPHLSTAIKLDPNNVYHYVNRSFCFLRIAIYNSAVKDASYVTKNTNDNTILAKANYLLGKGYYGLRNYEQAEKSMQKCLDLFPRNLCYIRESLHFKISQLLNMGFGEKDALLALKNHPTVTDAMEILIAGTNMPRKNDGGTNNYDANFIFYDETELFYSDDEDNPSNTRLLSSVLKEKFPNRCDRIRKMSSTKQCPTVVVNAKDYMRKRKRFK